MSIEDGTEVAIQLDVLNEQVILAAALCDKADRTKLTRVVTADHFLSPENAAAWTEVVLPMQKQGLEWDAATAQGLAGDQVDIEYLIDLVEARPLSPPNLDHHLAEMFWQRSKKTALEGPMNSLIEALRDPKSDPERVAALARQIPATLGVGQRRYLCDPREVVRQMMHTIDQRRSGEGFFPFGLDCLDYFESRKAASEAGFKVDHIPEFDAAGVPTRYRRMLVGTAPGKVSGFTGMSGSGKTTVLGNVARALSGKRGRFRKVLIGAWEADAPTYLQLITGTKLVYSRTDLMEGRIDDEMRDELEKTATGLSQRIQFMHNPFFDGSIDKPSNDRNLDLIASHIADSGCDVFIADLFERCLDDDRPSAEKRALFRMQALLEQLRVHGILSCQQRKDVQLRPDKKPTAEGIQGTGAWFQVMDSLFGVHRPSMWKRIEDNSLEIFVLKQRDGKFPLGVQIPHDPDTGVIEGPGRSIPYDLAGTSVGDGFDGGFPMPRTSGARKKKSA